MTKQKKKTKPVCRDRRLQYSTVLKDLIHLIEEAHRISARAVNAVMTATYWMIGRRIVEQEQAGRKRAGYGEQILKHLVVDLTKRFGRGFSRQNLQRFRQFYLSWPQERIRSTSSGKSITEKCSTLSSISLTRKKTQPAQSLLQIVSQRFPLPWSAYVRILSVTGEQAREFYEEEALRGGWSVRQLDRQINSMFYERTALSKNKAAMLKKGSQSRLEDIITPEQEIKDPYVLEFLSLKDEYSENDLEEALIHHLENFLLELGGDFAFIGRQKRLRIGDEWYRVDLIFFHRRLKCLMIVDLKIGKFTHADAGQMHMYLNYVREHWTRPDENPPVGLILCARKNTAVAKYSLKDMPNKILAAEYKTVLPDEKLIEKELKKTREMLEQRKKKIKNTTGGKASTPQVPRKYPASTPQAREILEYCRIPRSRDQIQIKLKLKDRKHFRRVILKPLIESGYLKLLIPDKPNSPKQKYVSAKNISREGMEI